MEQIKLGVMEREKFVYWNVLLKQRFFLEFSDNQESNAKIEINEFSIEVWFLSKKTVLFELDQKSELSSFGDERVSTSTEIDTDYLLWHCLIMGITERHFAEVFLEKNGSFLGRKETKITKKMKPKNGNKISRFTLPIKYI